MVNFAGQLSLPPWNSLPGWFDLDPIHQACSRPGRPALVTPRMHAYRSARHRRAAGGQAFHSDIRCILKLPIQCNLPWAVLTDWIKLERTTTALYPAAPVDQLAESLGCELTGS